MQKSTKLTNSFKNRATDKIEIRKLVDFVRQSRQADAKSVSLPELLSVFNDFAEFVSLSKTSFEVSMQEKEILVCKIASTGFIEFDETLIKCITTNPLGSFHLGLAIISNAAVIGEMALIQLIIQMVEEELGKKLATASIIDIQKARASAKQFLFSLRSLKISEYFIPICAEAGCTFCDALDVQENICSNRFIYRDNHLAISWFPSNPENNDRFRAAGELTIAVKRPNGLWSFDKHSNIRIPVTSLRRAREHCLRWRGQKMHGQITHSEAKRIAKFLGFRIQGNLAHLFPVKDKGFGKK